MKLCSPSRVPRFLKRLPLLHEESVISFVQRHCCANRAARMLDVLRLIEQLSGEPLNDVRNLVFSLPALRAVEWLTGLPEGTLDSRHVRLLQGTHIVFGHHVWLRTTFWAERQGVCPACLGEHGYAKVSWDFVQAPVCLEHGAALLEYCPACSAPLRHRRTRITHCGECDFALASAAVVPTSAAARAAGALVQQPVMVAMGNPESTAPIDGQDLSDLLRLCVPAGPGRMSSFGLTGPLSVIPVHARIEALERLGSALVGRRVESATLRNRAIERWPAACMLAPSNQNKLLSDAAGEMEMDVEVARLLCHGDDIQRDKRAAEFFERRPPQLATESDVASYLGVSLLTLKKISGREGLVKSVDDVGHDMDQVLNLQRTIAELYLPRMLDEVFGLAGLTYELYKLKLLEGYESEDGALIGVEPRAFASLMSRLQAVISPEAFGFESAIPLAQAVLHGMGPAAVAWLVSQVAGGSLAAFSWPKPQRVMNLRVDGGRMRHLITQTKTKPRERDAGPTGGARFE